MVSILRVLSRTCWVAPAFFPVTATTRGISGTTWAVYLLLAGVAGTYLAVRTEHSGGRVGAFALTAIGTYLVAGVALGYPVNSRPVTVDVLVPFWLLGLSVGYTVWLGDGLARIRERLPRTT